MDPFSFYRVTPSNNAVAPVSTEPKVVSVEEPSISKRGCCKKAWHCDSGDFYCCCGNGKYETTYPFTVNSYTFYKDFSIELLIIQRGHSTVYSGKCLFL